VTVFVDSDILIEILRARDSAIQSQWLSLGTAEATILYSPISSAEIWEGARPKEREQTSRLFRPLICVPIDESIGILAGHFLRHYNKSHSLELPDAMIAASAHQSRAPLWTRNRKHYPMPELSFY
jgi:predicted nucleic acid-binding protein